MKIMKALGIALLVVATVELNAQTTSGRILGTVHDQTGAAIPNATVIVTDTQRSVSRQAATDGSGNFVVAALPPSVYTIRAEATGFKTVEHQGVQLEVARDISLDFTLPAGAVRQEVVVTSEVPMVNTTNATLGGTLSNKEIIDLPLNGRNYADLALLTTNVHKSPLAMNATTPREGAFKLSIAVVSRHGALLSLNVPGSGSCAASQRFLSAFAALLRRFVRKNLAKIDR